MSASLEFSLNILWFGVCVCVCLCDSAMAILTFMLYAEFVSHSIVFLYFIIENLAVMFKMLRI